MFGTIRKAGIPALSIVLVLSMVISVFAVSGASDSDRTDYNTNRTGNSTAVRQANSSDTGTVRLGKILTVNQSGKFPNIEDFVYKITPVAAWDNANESTSKSGRSVSPAAMPKPSASGAVHHKITVTEPDGVDNAPWTALVAIGNFKDGSDNNTSGIYGDRLHEYVNSDSASNSDKIPEGKRRTRVTDVSFRFTKAGYYMYRIEEAGSRQNGSIDSLSGLKKDVAGVDYDNNSYYVVFYVCNCEATEDVKADGYGNGTRRGDTVNGVYVHTITSWTNRPSSSKTGQTATDYRPDNSMRTSDKLADEKEWLHDLMQSQDVDKKYNTDSGDGGHPAMPNTGRADNNNAGITEAHPGRSNGVNGSAGETSPGPSTVTHDNIGKVGISTPKNPNYLEAYRMWNAQITHDVVLKKSVAGNLGDRTKEFVFEVTLTGLEANQTYTTDVPAGSTDDTEYAGESTDDVTSARVKMYDMTPSTSLSEDGRSFTTDAAGKVSFRVKLRDGEMLVLNALPRSASYRITEMESDHVAQYNIVSSNKSSEHSAVFTETNHTPGGSDAAHLGDANTDANQALSTKLEFVDRYDGTVTIIFRNNRDIATLTGVAGLDYMTYALSLALILGAGAMIVRRRREYAEEEELLV